MISVLIITKDEEKSLPDCLDSINFSDDILILDSFSTDQTVKIAKEMGAKTYQRVFDDYASQRNYGLF